MTNRTPGTPDEPSARSASDSEGETTLWNQASPAASGTAAGSFGGDTTEAGSNPVASGIARPTTGPPSDIDVRIQDFEIQEEIGHGAMGSVFRAKDRRNGREVALKRLLVTDPSRLTLFKSEFRELADLAHPHLATLYELVSDGETWFLTMELLDGFNFGWYVRLGPHPDAETSERKGANGSMWKTLRLREVLRQLAHGLWALHQAGKVHRDIKPANVMVTADGHVKLLDFGLITDVHADRVEEGLHGTVPYISPEQASGKPASPASDWYAVGVMLYELLTGRMPYRGRMGQVLILKQEVDPPAPSEIASDVPQDLERLCIALMQRDPDQRPTGDEVLKTLKVENRQLAQATSAAPEDQTPFVGRYDQTVQLQSTLDALRAGKSQIILVDGPSGVGKTAMVRRFLDRARTDGVVVLSGRCYERESVPFKAWDSLVDGLAQYLGRLRKIDVAALIPRRTAPLLTVFPVLQRVPALAEAAGFHSVPDDQHELRAQAFAALRELLTRIGDRSPLVLFIDDVQWGDADSAAVQVDMLRSPDALPAMLLGTVRSEDAAYSEYLKTLSELREKLADPPPLEKISVEPLSRDESIDLALRLLHRVDDDAQAVAVRIANEADGNPFFIQELIRGMELPASINSEAERADEASPKDPSLKDVLWRRISHLSDSARRLLEVIAVCGAPIDESLSFAVAETDSSGPNLLAQLRSGLLVRAIRSGADGRIACYHDQISETILARLDAETQAGHHLRLAQALVRASNLDAILLRKRLDENAGGDGTIAGLGTLSIRSTTQDNIFDVAVHFDAAGEHKQALPFAYAAAARAHKQYSLETAEQQYRIAERGAATDEPVIQFHIARSLGDVLMLRGLYDGAAERFERALELAPDDLSKADVLARVAELKFKQGDPVAPIRVYEEAMRIGGFSTPPKNKLLLGLQVLRFASIQVLHSLMPSTFPRRTEVAPGQQEALRLQCLHGATLPFMFVRGPLFGLWAHLQDLNRSEKYPGSREVARAYARHVFLMNLLGRRSRARKYGERSLKIRRDLGHRWGVGQTLTYVGVTHILESNLDRAVESLREATGIFEETGDWFEHNLANAMLSMALYRLDQLDEAAFLAERVYRSGVTIGDFQIAGISLAPWALATKGQVPDDVLETERNRPRDESDIVASTLVHGAQGLCYLHAGELQQALESVNRADEFRRQMGVDTMMTAPVVMWRLQALLAVAASHPEGSPERKELLRQGHKTLRLARKLMRKFPVLGHEVHRETAELQLLAGDRAGAIRRLEECLARSEQSVDRYQHRMTSERLAELQSSTSSAS